ncbi:MAG: squalene/phytoene synthase family protein [Gammaproteobacteria bacterium]|nr:squalene/phytoene synthase family protein [Gammaproteobacteria bacterium]
MPVIPPAEVAPGSDLYYALLYADAHAQRKVAAVELACIAINGVVLECSDPGIARLRLAWWHEELERLDADSPSHETTRALAAAGLPAGTGAALRPVVEATETLLSTRTTLPEHDYEALLQGLSDTRWSLTFASLRVTTDAALSAGLELMRLREAAQLLMDTRRFLDRGIVPLPAAAGDPPADVDAMLSGGDAVATQLAEQTGALRARLRATLAGRPAGVPLPALVLARIAGTTLDEVLRDGCALLRRRIALPPVRKLGIAWRCAVGRRLLLIR